MHFHLLLILHAHWIWALISVNIVHEYWSGRFSFSDVRGNPLMSGLLFPTPTTTFFLKLELLEGHLTVIATFHG